jgi:hypothetical protein
MTQPECGGRTCRSRRSRAIGRVEVDAYRGDPGFETTLTYERRRLRATSNTAAAMVNSATMMFIQRRAIRPVAKQALPHLESRLRVAAARPRAARHSLSP